MSLRVFVYPAGGPEHVEIPFTPTGLSMAGLKEGRKAHLWWSMEVVEKEPSVARMLRSLVPTADRLWVGREVGGGGQLQTVFDGTLVETGYDPTMVTLTGIEPPRQAYPPAPPASGVREPLHPAPTGPGPVSTQPPGPLEPTAHGDGQAARLDVFTQARQGAVPVPLGQQTG